MSNDQALQVIKETDRFKLYFSPLPNGVENVFMNYRIVIKYETEEVEVGNVYALTCLTLTDKCEYASPTFTSTGTNLQDCITSWELYKEFIMVIDEAFERLEMYRCEH